VVRCGVAGIVGAGKGGGGGGGRPPPLWVSNVGKGMGMSMFRIRSTE